MCIFPGLFLTLLYPPTQKNPLISCRLWKRMGTGLTFSRLGPPCSSLVSTGKFFLTVIRMTLWMRGEFVIFTNTKELNSSVSYLFFTPSSSPETHLTCKIVWVKANVWVTHERPSEKKIHFHSSSKCVLVSPHLHTAWTPVQPILFLCHRLPHQFHALTYSDSLCDAARPSGFLIWLQWDISSYVGRFWNLYCCLWLLLHYTSRDHSFAYLKLYHFPTMICHL